MKGGAHQVLRQSLEPVGLKLAAHQLRLSGGLVERWCKPEACPVDPLNRVLEIVRMTGNLETVDWLCLKNGGFFAPHAEEGESVAAGARRLAFEFSRLLSCLASSNCSEEHRRAWQHFKSVGEGFVSGIESMGLAPS
jgi:hypothetical protein